MLRAFCDPKHIGETLADHWLKDQDRRRDYVYMLNRLLGSHLYRCGVRHHAHYKRHYFPREDDEVLEFKRDWHSVRTNHAAPERLTAKFYEYGPDAFWRHLAATFSFKQFGNSWFLQVLPGYLLTTNGRDPYDPERIGALITKIKARERNPHVLNHILFWADVLSQRKPTIEVQLDFRTAMIIEKLPYAGIAAFAIPDDPAVFDEPPESEQGSFLDLLFSGQGDIEDAPVEHASEPGLEVEVEGEEEGKRVGDDEH